MHKTNTHQHAAAAVAAAAAPVALLLYKNMIYVIFYTHAFKYNFIQDYSSIGFNDRKYLKYNSHNPVLMLY